MLKTPKFSSFTFHDMKISLNGSDLEITVGNSRLGCTIGGNSSYGHWPPGSSYIPISHFLN